MVRWFVCVGVLLVAGCIAPDRSFNHPCEDPSLECGDDARAGDGAVRVDQDAPPADGAVADAGALVLAPIGDRIISVGDRLIIELRADGAVDVPAFAIRSMLPDGAVFDPDRGRFDWAPRADQVGTVALLTFEVSDGRRSDQETIRITVVGANRPPVIEPAGDHVVFADFLFELQIEASDPDDDPLTYSIRNRPPGAVLSAEGLFSWNPAVETVGRTYAVEFAVRDARGGEVTTSANFEVRSAEELMCEPDPGASPLRIEPDQGYARSICPAGERDSYLIAGVVGRQLVVSIDFAHADGDLDLVLFGPDERPVATSSGLRDGEEVRHLVVEGGDYRAQVYAVDPAATTTYTLRARFEAPPACVDDRFEGNVGRETAVPIADALGVPLVICENRVDWFSVDLEGGVETTITARFVHADGDIDARLSRLNGEPVVAGRSADDDEILRYTSPQTDRYLLEVYGYRLGENGYTLSMDPAPMACEADRLEPNDTHEQAQALAPDQYRNLTACGDDDWFRTEVRAGYTLIVYVSHDGRQVPSFDAQTAQRTPLAFQATAGVVGEGCQPERARCDRFSVESDEGGRVHYQIGVADGRRYDLNLREAAECDAARVTCGVLAVCDYATGACVDAFCDDACPDQHACHQEWCVESCRAGACPHPRHTCKLLAGQFRCGVAGNAPLGGACVDFSDCSGRFDCLIAPDVPGGYCTRSCAASGECPGGHCVDVGEAEVPDEREFLCAQGCSGDDECRDGYRCNQGTRIEGDLRGVCTPDNP